MLENLFSKSAESRAISFQTLFASGGEFRPTTLAGVAVTQESSLSIATVYACVRLISDSISTLPVDTFVRSSDGERRPYRPRPEWLDYPESGVPRTTHFQMCLVSLLLDGNAFVRIIRDGRGVAGLSVLNPKRVEVKRDLVSRRPVFVIDDRETVAADEMLHITEMRLPGELRGKSRIDLISESLGLAAALEKFAATFFGSGSMTSGIIEFPGNLTREQAADLAAGFDQAHRTRSRSKAHKTGVLFGGAKYQKTSVEPNEAQMLESRQHEVETIARAFRCPPQLLGVTTPGAQSYASVEMNGIHFVQHCLRPYLVLLEEAHNTLLPRDAYIHFNVDGLLRGDQQSRMAALSQGMLAGIYSVNDARRLLDAEPVDGGDVYRVPLANVNTDTANLSELDKKVTIAQRLVYAGFDPASVLAALDMPPIAHSGVPSVQLQGVAQIDPEDPDAVYDAS